MPAPAETSRSRFGVPAKVISGAASGGGNETVAAMPPRREWAAVGLRAPTTPHPQGFGQIARTPREALGWILPTGRAGQVSSIGRKAGQRGPGGEFGAAESGHKRQRPCLRGLERVGRHRPRAGMTSGGRQARVGGRPRCRYRPPPQVRRPLAELHAPPSTDARLAQVGQAAFGTSPWVTVRSTTEKVAPCGSDTVAKRPNGLSTGPKCTMPPCSLTVASAASQSSTAK